MNDFLRNRKGEPVFVIGLQAHNSSTGTVMIGRTMDAIALYGGNTIEAPVYWYAAEPEEDHYDLSQVKELIDKARSRGLYLIILWFGANKNGHPNYAPEYIKLQPEIYRIAVGPDGAPVASISPHCYETMERDKKAFLEMIRFIRDYDAETGTVLAVQIENEFGYAQTDRDYSALAQADYERGVPEALIGVELEDMGPLTHDGSWVGEFGRHANEAFSAWYHARYVEALAAAGKEIDDMTFFCNIFIGETGIEVPGFSYNGGGGVGRVIDVWKKAAPHLDLLCPDIYLAGRRVYERICSRYARKDNALMIPESSPMGDANAMNLMLAVGKYGAVGVAGFGAESALDDSGKLLPEARKVALTMRAIAGLAPLLIKSRGTGRVYGVIQDEFTSEEYIRTDRYHVTAKFFKGTGVRGGFTSNVNLRAPENAYLKEERGRGILIRTGEDEFFLAGVNIGFEFRRRTDMNDPKAYVHLSSRQSTQLNFLSVEEGHFDAEGNWVVDFIRNGDETNFTQYSAFGNVIRVRLNPNIGM
ncbi:MAG: DUF5597 domain-containing protein [Lachnospiraceae bacterium]|nr:DUF5597 domain-containing protein [Lachnospiraceae bacterium]